MSRGVRESVQHVKWDDEIHANRVMWRGVEYDSQLEADWAATFTKWGMLYVYHPGRLFLSDGVVWEPDFQLDGDVVFEVKGSHNNRIEKVEAAGNETDLKIVIGRAGWIPGGADIEQAGAVWEPEDWIVVEWDDRMVFTQVADTRVHTAIFASARVAYDMGVNGIRMYKAVGEDGIV